MTDIEKVKEIYRNACFTVLNNTLERVPHTEAGAVRLLALVTDLFIPNCIIGEFSVKFLPSTEAQRRSGEMPDLEVKERYVILDGPEPEEV